MRCSRKLFLLVPALIALFHASSCTSSKQEPKPLYNSQDTIEVTNMAETYLGYLSRLEYDKALDMLSEVTNDTIRPLRPETREQYLANYQTFPVLEYSSDKIEWGDFDPILLHYNIVFGKGVDDVPYTTKTVLQPIRVNGVWYLMLYKSSVIR